MTALLDETLVDFRSRSARKKRDVYVSHDSRRSGNAMEPGALCRFTVNEVLGAVRAIPGANTGRVGQPLCPILRGRRGKRDKDLERNDGSDRARVRDSSSRRERRLFSGQPHGDARRRRDVSCLTGDTTTTPRRRGRSRGGVRVRTTPSWAARRYVVDRAHCGRRTGLAGDCDDQSGISPGRAD